MFFAHERGRMVAIYIFGQQLGSILGLILGGYIADGIGWRWSSPVVAIAAVSISSGPPLMDWEGYGSNNEHRASSSSCSYLLSTIRCSLDTDLKINCLKTYPPASKMIKRLYQHPTIKRNMSLYHSPRAKEKAKSPLLHASISKEPLSGTTSPTIKLPGFNTSVVHSICSHFPISFSAGSSSLSVARPASSRSIPYLKS